MTNKKEIEQQTRGWVPKEPSSTLPTNKKIKITALNNKIGAISNRTIGGLGLGSFVLGFVLLLVPYLLFPEHYIPKANSAGGYVAPQTTEAWIILASALALISFSIFAFTLYGVKLKIQGSKWMKYTYWIIPGYEKGFGKNLFKIAVVTNALIVSSFAGFFIFTAITAQSTASRLPLLIVFTVLMTSVNLFLHEYGKRQITKQKERQHQ
jgi:hypothetical protein